MSRVAVFKGATGVCVKCKFHVIFKVVDVVYITKRTILIMVCHKCGHVIKVCLTKANMAWLIDWGDK